MSKLYTTENVAQIIQDMNSDDSGSDQDEDSSEDAVASNEEEVSDDDDSDDEDASNEGEVPEDNAISNHIGSASTDIDHENNHSSVSTSADGTQWHQVMEPIAGRTSQHNVFRARPGTANFHCRSPIDAWSLFIDRPILQHVMNCTNEAAKSDHNDTFELGMADLKRFIAVQYARGIYGKSHPVDFLWSTSHGPNIFRDTISRTKFKNILKYLRFDVKATRATMTNLLLSGKFSTNLEFAALMLTHHILGSL